MGTATIDVIDVFGRRVMNETIAVDGARLNTMIKLSSDLADGLYVVNITAGDRVFTERLIIAK